MIQVLIEHKFDLDHKLEQYQDYNDLQLKIDETQQSVQIVKKTIQGQWCEWLKILHGEDLKFLKMDKRHKNNRFQSIWLIKTETLQQASTKSEFERLTTSKLKNLKQRLFLKKINQLQWSNQFLTNRIFIFLDWVM